MARLFDSLDTLRPRVEQAGRLLLFLDFDGTLAPIVPFPKDAEIPESTRAVLSEMAQRPDFLISLVSGRSVRDLQQRAAVSPVIDSTVILAGNHGLEIHGPEIDFVEPAALALHPALMALQGELRARLHSIEGVEVENKNLTTSVHFRRAPQARSRVLAALDELVDAKLFRVREGKMVAEVLPRVEANKGTAVRYIRAARAEEGDLSICAGDDTTDEDLFRAADGGVTVRVGDAGETAADFWVDGTDALREWFIWLLELKAQAARPPAAHVDWRHGQ
jgi:trehalose 6-phosphate phosphatase